MGYVSVGRARGALGGAERELAESQAAVTRFEASGRVSSLASDLASRQSLRNDYLQQVNQIQLNLNNASPLRRQLGGGQGNQATGLPLLLLGLSSFTSNATDVDPGQLAEPVASARDEAAARSAPRRTGGNSVLVQPTLETIAALTPAQQVAYLDSLVAALREKQTQLRADLSALQSEINRLSSQLEEARAEQTRLLADRDADQNTYRQLGALLSQNQVGSQIRAEKVSVSKAALAASQAGASGIVLPILGGLGGFLLGLVAAFLMEFARRPGRVASATRAEGVR